MGLEELKKQFLEYLEIERGRSAKTVENYDHYLERFFHWLGADKTLPALTEEAIRKYRVWLNRIEPPLKRSTQNYHVIAIRAFLKYLARQGKDVVPADRIDLAKQPEREVSFLDAKETERLLAAPDGTSSKAMRDRAILETLFSTGLRVSELCALNVDSVDIAKGDFSVRGKGDKIRVVFLSDSAKQALRDWLSARKDVVDQALFVRIPRGKSLNFTRLTPRSVERLVKHYAVKAGIVGKNVVPHTLRHSYATDLLRNGADLRSVQALLGHASITTTQVYTHVTDPQLKEVHRRFHGKQSGRST